VMSETGRIPLTKEELYELCDKINVEKAKIHEEVSKLKAKNQALLDALKAVITKLSYLKNEYGVSEEDAEIIIVSVQESIAEAIAEAIQGEPPAYGINSVKDGVLKFKNPDGSGKEGEQG